MIFWIFSVFVCANAANLDSTPAPQACTTQGLKIPLTPSGYSLPLTSFNGNQDCYYYFTVPKGYFAYVDLKAYQLQSNEFVFIADTSGVYVVSPFDSDFRNFSSIQAWPVDFHVRILIEQQTTKLQLSLNITVLPETPNANIVKSYVTFAGSSSVFLYSNDLNEGESYKFTSKSGKIYIVGAADWYASIGSDASWNNIFIYEGGVFKGTLARIVQTAWYQKSYISTSNEVILYYTKKVSYSGAVMITDYSNVQGVQHNFAYVSNAWEYDIMMNSTNSESAFTVLSDRANPKQLTVRDIEEMEGPGVVSYIAGGPIQNHSNSKNVSVTQPPMVITGYVNTFYLNRGLDFVTLHIQ